MKKILIIFLFASLGLKAQNVLLTPNPLSGINSSSIFINNALNQPGFVHGSTNFIFGPSLGTVIKADGPYFQTFTNHPLIFSANDGLACMTIQTDGNILINNGTFVGGGGFIKNKKYTGFIDGYDLFIPGSNDGTPDQTTIPHGLTANRILSVKLMIEVASTVKVGDGYTYANGFEANFSYDNTNIYVWKKPGNSSNIYNKPFSLLVTYTHSFN